jgi:hypothetical protein
VPFQASGSIACQQGCLAPCAGTVASTATAGNSNPNPYQQSGRSAAVVSGGARARKWADAFALTTSVNLFIDSGRNQELIHRMHLRYEVCA